MEAVQHMQTSSVSPLEPFEWLMHRELIRDWSNSTEYLRLQGFDFDIMEELYKNNKLFFWKVILKGEVKALVAVQIAESAIMKELQVIWAVGENAELWGADLFAAVMSYAFANNCRKVVVKGREGLLPVLKRFGFTFEYASYALDVPDIQMN